MRAKRFHGLKRLKIRQSWNKFNLYNLWRLKPLLIAPKTFFQQKWLAKSTSRAYHGEQIREKQWQRRFTSKIRSVVPMDHRYLAAFDGSEQAQGRGSGRDLPYQGKALPATPYMQMTYAPIERRLDTAIFRALFASSARQARQFVIHGAVKVNGKKMIYPGYLLNPGDMFQVEPERVMFATGAPKDAQERKATRRIRRKAQRSKEESVETSERVEEVMGEDTSAPTPAPASKAGEVDDEDSKRESSKIGLKDLLQKAKSILNGKDKVGSPSAKRKQELRAFTASVRKAIGQINRKSAQSLESTVSNLDDELSTLLSSLSVSRSAKSANASPTTPSDTSSSASTTDSFISEVDSDALREALKEAHDNPIDPTKPYATPWRPRPYMSAFAFIPRYLEVNQNVCAAVYLRHPVARPGLAEVPTPFGETTNQLAFTWYLRRR